MAGIIGIVNYLKTDYNDFRKALLSLKTEVSYYTDQVVSADEMFIGRVHPGILNEQKRSPYIKEHLSIWLYGEMFEENKIIDQVFCERIFHSYVNNSLETDLKNFNGIFTFLLKDAKENKLLLANDRFGLSRMHVFNKGNLFAFASDLKAFSYFKDIELKISKFNLECFLDLGHFLGQNTYFEDLKLLPPATIATYHLSERKISYTNYWKWSYIHKSNIKFDFAKEMLFDIFKNAIRIRQTKNQILSLSGGLDSRAILAQTDKKIITYSYGSKGCLDVKLARQLASLDGNTNVFYEIMPVNWFEGKPEGIWKNDGMSSCFHMHFSKFHKEIGTLGSINQNGFLGDVILGGSYLYFNKLDKKIDYKTAKKRYGDYVKLSNLDDEYFSFNSSDPYFIYNRGVRFISMGSVESSRFIEHRKPFLDYNLIDFVFSLPDNYRWMSKLYNSFLLHYYPKYFKSIPWQRTGLIISPYPTITLLQLGNKAKNHLLYRLQMKKNKENYTNYKQWIKSNNFAKLFYDLNNNAIYKDVLGYDKKQLLQDHFNHSKNNVEKIGNLVTAEIYLQQIFNGKYKSSYEIVL